MEIQVTFNSIEEMEEFCQRTISRNRVKQEEPIAQSPAPVSVSVASIPASAAVPLTPTQAVAPATAAMPACAAPSTVPTAVPTAGTSYTLDELARAAIALVDSGKQVDLQQLLAQFGVEALPVLPKEQYGAFATALRGMGAQI